MNSWFFIALLAPLLWSIVNHVDKLILSKYENSRGVGAIMLFSSLYAIAVLPLITLFFGYEILNLPVYKLLLLLLVGMVSAGGFYFYLKSIDIEEASVVVPLMQLIPIFGYILGFIILKETLTLSQIASCLLILSGIAVISFEIDVENKFKFKKQVVGWVILSSFLFALEDVLFKMVTKTETFWVSIFWQHAGLLACGLLIFLSSKKTRLEFYEIFKTKKKSLIGLNVLSESLYILGNFANNFAALLAPVALVLVVSSYQPIFVFFIGMLLTVFLPKIAKEKISLKHLAHKLISILVIVLGSYFLYSNS